MQMHLFVHGLARLCVARSARRSCQNLLCASIAIALIFEAESLGKDGRGLSPFTEEAEARGLAYLPTPGFTAGQGFAFVDLDDDGDADVILLGRKDGVVGLFENDGTGHFIDRSPTCGIAPMERTSGVIAADYDRDNDLDLLIICTGAADSLYRNDGGFVLTDVTAASGLGESLRGAGSSWGDFDNDGWLDVYIANYGQPNRLFHNQGDGTFVNVAVNLGVQSGNDVTYQAAFFDFDRDADADLYLATDRGVNCGGTQYNHLFENRGGAFVDITESSGTAGCVDGMCIAVGDLDRNGFADIYVTNTPSGNALMMNNGDRTFTRYEHIAGVESFATGWGSVFFDFDNDGLLDLHVCNDLAPNRLYRNPGAMPCDDVAASVGLADANRSFICATADVDLDGDLDLMTMNLNTPIRLYINHEGEKRNWVKFDVLGLGADRYAIGANIEVRSGAIRQLREVIAGHNFKSQNELVQHFGMDDMSVIDAVEVTWLGGTTRTITNVPVNQTWTLIPPDRLGDFDRDGDHDIEDFQQLRACFAADNPGSILPGCEVFDFLGDSDVDAADAEQFLYGFAEPLIDCNENGVADLMDILTGFAMDQNSNGVPDDCEPYCRLDVWPRGGGDGVVNLFDLLEMLAEFGRSDCGRCDIAPAIAGQLVGDGVVDAEDVVAVIHGWGDCEP